MFTCEQRDPQPGVNVSAETLETIGARLSFHREMHERKRKRREEKERRNERKETGLGRGKDGYGKGDQRLRTRCLYHRVTMAE